MKTLTAELFAVGKWNGYTFTLDDLKEMVSNFDYLKDIHFAPIKLGHDDKQPLTDGEPALGEIESVWIGKGKDGRDKLMGKLIGLPDIVYNAIDKNLYKKVSIELELGVKHKSRFMKYVLTGVALLGAELPAVNTLADLKAYMSRKSLTSLFTDHKDKAMFSRDNLTITNEVTKMDEIEKLCLQFGVQGKSASSLIAFVSGLQTENTKLKSDVEEFAKKDAEREEAAKKATIKTARDNVKALFEKAVTDKVITPAQRDQFSKVLHVDDDVAVVNINTKDVEELIASEGDSSLFTKNKSKSGKTEETVSDAGEALNTEAYKIMNSNEGMTYELAFSRAMQANPELAKEHAANEVATN